MRAGNDSRTYGFVVVSTITHVALAAGILAISIQTEHRRSEATQIEVLAADSPAPAPSLTEVAKAPVQAEASRPAEAPSQAPVTAAPAQPVLVQKSIPRTLPAARHAPRVAAVPTVSDTPTQEEASAVLPISQATELSQPQDDIKPDLKDEDIADDLKKVDQEENSNIAAAHQDLSKKTEEVMQEQETQLAALQKRNQEESERQAKDQMARREREREALAAVAADRIAKENQAAREAAQARQAEAARVAQEAKMAEQAKAQAIVAGNGTGSGIGAGKGSEVDVRALSELKQMPGNKAPHYDSDDRLQGRQGEVAFLAYVAQNGSVTEFKMLQSSGHRALDSKTLKAIKEWKFYPGQEGWVEIPFKWDLKGGPQEMPTRLRMKSQASQNQNG